MRLINKWFDYITFCFFLYVICKRLGLLMIERGLELVIIIIIIQIIFIRLCNPVTNTKSFGLVCMCV
jgi:hypothetical protein